MWTTRETEDREVETIDDDDARVLFHEQMRRRIAEIHKEDLERQRRERTVIAGTAQNWGQQVARVRDTRNRMLGSEWPEGDDKKEIGFLTDYIDGRLPKKEKILKPLPDELFEID